MFARKKQYYHIDDMPKKKSRLGNSRRFSALLIVFLFGAGVYGLVLLQAPELLINHASAAGQSSEEALVNTNTDFIEMQDINLITPISHESSESAHEKTVWQRHPELGNPEKGGNFILTALRFKLGLTPNATKENSPFYNLDKLQEKDVIKVYYNTKWYSYEVTKIYNTKADDNQVEASSNDATLTLLASNSDGTPDYNVVVEAKLVQGAKPTPAANPSTPLL